MKILCVVPSRLGSTRLPRKPLRIIQGKPMIQWVYERASKCNLIDRVVVATDNQEIASVIEQIGGEAVITDANFSTGTDRVAAVARAYTDVDVVINLQGDEPFIQPKILEELVSFYINGENPEMSTVAFALEPKYYIDPNVVKVIVDRKNFALYFSRSPIPYLRVNDKTLDQFPVYHHMGLYAFRRDFLLEFAKMSQTPLEIAESLEQLRALENGYRIKVAITSHKTLEINLPEELEAAQHFKYQEEN